MFFDHTSSDNFDWISHNVLQKVFTYYLYIADNVLWIFKSQRFDFKILFMRVFLYFQ
jgi:hypothetical protein